MINKKQKEFLKDCNDLIESKKEETFESYWNSNFKDVCDNNSKYSVLYFTNEEIIQLKQLHDTDLKLCDKHIHDLKCEINEMFIKLKEKDKEIENHIFMQKQFLKEIKELQAENEKLNYAIKRFNEEDMK